MHAYVHFDPKTYAHMYYYIICMYAPTYVSHGCTTLKIVERNPSLCTGCSLSYVCPLVSLPSPYTRKDSQHVAQVASLEEELEGHLNDIILEYSARVSTYVCTYLRM